MGFGFKIAPGVKIYPGSRGLGVGLYAGPVSYYTRTSGRRRSSVASYQRQLRAQQRAEEIEAVAALDRELVRIATVHEEDFPLAQPPSAQAAEDVDQRVMLKELQAEELEGISRLSFGERREAKARANERLGEAVEAERQRRAEEEAAAQAELDEAWQLLVANDPDTVLATLEAAFSDNESAAAAVSCDGDRVDVLMRWFTLDEIVGERKVAVTPAGNPTVRKRSEKDRRAFYLEAMASNALATAKEAFAVAPGLNQCALLVFRGEPDAAFGDTVLEVLYQGILHREELERIRWEGINPIATLHAIPESELGAKGKTLQIKPVDVSDDAVTVAMLARVADTLGWRSAYGDAELPELDREADGEFDLGDEDASLLSGLEKACLVTIEQLMTKRGEAGLPSDDFLFIVSLDKSGHRVIGVSFDTVGAEREEEVAEVLAEHKARAAGFFSSGSSPSLYLCDRTGDDSCRALKLQSTGLKLLKKKAAEPAEAGAIRAALGHG